VIRDPHTKRQLPPDGDDVPDSVFWYRRLAAGEVVRLDEAGPVDNAIRPLTNRGGK
jgi:hypothetical protein